MSKVSTFLALFFVLVLSLAPASAEAQTFSVLYTFTGGTDGAQPYGLTLAGGTLYGTTSFGGAFGDGNVFKLKGKNETVLHSFAGAPDGEFPTAPLLYHNGTLYGTTSEGGGCNSSCGTVFTIDTATNNENVLYRFTGGVDGDYADAGLIRDSLGNLYGVTDEGGASGCQNFDGVGCGVVFMVDPAGKETVLYNFSGGTDGWLPEGNLVLHGGKLYGTTSLGGDFNCDTAEGCGVVFKLNKSRQLLTVLHAFTGGADGNSPDLGGGLVFDGAGNLYGTTNYGGGTGCSPSPGCGVVFKIDKLGNESVLYRFSGGQDGYRPKAGLLLDSGGNLYGTTLHGGSFGSGTIYKLSPTGVHTVLYSFTGGADGREPSSPLVRDSKGNLYGTTLLGGGSGCGGGGCGVVFKFTP